MCHLPRADAENGRFGRSGWQAPREAADIIGKCPGVRLSMIENPLLFIGGGTMARAIVGGALAAGVVSARRVAVVDPSPTARENLPVGLGLVTDRIVNGYAWLAREDGPDTAGQVVLAVKPQHLGAAAAELGPLLDSPRVVISILAGASIARVSGALGRHARVVRVMPNMPARIRLGMTAISVGAGVTSVESEGARALFGSLGKVVEIDESLMDAFTAVAGSGPAYLFYLAEAMIRGATELGFSGAEADAIVRQTLHGAAALLAGSVETAGRLREAVTSKGGTTEAALGVFAGAGLDVVVGRAMAAARDRGRELASM